ncbi:hypothetical protein E2C01_028792 [Portunus trituberculatus]|uniref:Uncharacterized protein n=1 Tax=Portunus trituberculatus TaxID=210409 RepID=A0A5B7ELL3_PORTR|nr:hypothetical protein [Portunus trituberculatus]
MKQDSRKEADDNRNNQEDHKDSMESKDGAVAILLTRGDLKLLVTRIWLFWVTRWTRRASTVLSTSHSNRSPKHTGTATQHSW